ncbi:lantibiotic dehydratase [Streptomyces sp. NPDC058476]|uniref:lantibiotic dehydratase n=1 Tax=Streptomyces sp. NPDC058476 TaxID=3346519 RepID=UPI00365C7EC3
MPSNLFTASNPVLVRMASLPTGYLSPFFRTTGVGQPTEAELVAYVKNLAKNPVLREAIRLSSTSLDGLLAKVDEGEKISEKRLLKAAVSLTKYALRITGRPTPFGIFAGVAAGRFENSTEVTVGAGHRKSVRPDAGWLSQVVSSKLLTENVPDSTRVVASDLIFTRGNRVHSSWSRGVEDGNAKVEEVSIRLTPAVRVILARARSSVSYGELLQTVASRTGMSESAVAATVVVLIRNGFLLASIFPRESSISRLNELESNHPGKGFRGAALALTAYAEADLGEGGDQLKQALDKLQAIHDFPRPPLHVDLHMDVKVTLPRSVGESLESLATDLWRISPHNLVAGHMAEYATAFVERYGFNRAVGVPELIDPLSGLGLPATYKGSTRSAGQHHHHSTDEDARIHALTEAVQESLSSGSREIVLDESLARRLETEKKGPAGQEVLPPSIELCVQLLASSSSAIEAGDYQLVMSRYIGANNVGPTFGRFAETIGATTALRELIAREDNGARRAQLRFEPNVARYLNVAQTPDFLPNQLPVGMYPEGGEQHNIDWRDLAVVANDEGLRLLHRKTGEEIVPVSLTALSLELTAPPVARFLFDIANSYVPSWSPWSWGPLDAFPFLPRVRHGKVIVKPARWKLPSFLADGELPWEEWQQRFSSWRGRWLVPRHVQMAARDETCYLDLDDPIHCRLLRLEISSRDVEISENLAARTDAFGWIGNHANELVVPLCRSPRVSPQARPRTIAIDEETMEPFTPGSEWLYAKIYTTLDAQNVILSTKMPNLLNKIADHIDSWFYIRYTDPEPHVRLRLRGSPETLMQHVLPALHGFLDGLRGERLIGKWVLDSYEPESHRYGGREAVRAAEELFCLDSTNSMSQIGAKFTRRLSVPDEIIAAANYAMLLESLGDWNWCEWVEATYPNETEYRRHYRAVRALAQTWITPGSCVRTFTEVSGLSEVEHAWKNANAALVYGELLHRRMPSTRRDIALRGVLHMHHNRLIGIDPESEKKSYAILRGVARDYIGRIVRGR